MADNNANKSVVTTRVIEVMKPKGIRLKPQPAGTSEERIGLMLLPGENTVTESFWQLAVKERNVRTRLATGTLKDRGPGKANAYTNGLDSLGLNQALLQVAKATSVQLLQDWNQKTTNIAVKKEIKERIATLIAKAE
jgi:hypothetical protein